jgi:hypothetical protein
MSEAFWGIVGTIVGALIGHFSASSLWKKQYDVNERRRGQEKKKAEEEAKSLRLNYLNDLIIECSQNQEILTSYQAKIIKNSSMTFAGLNVGNIERFERDYPSLFLFNKKNRQSFHEFMNEVKKYQKRWVASSSGYGIRNVPYPYCDFDGVKLENQITNVDLFKTFLEKAVNNDCNFKWRRI